jgi:hypothetical protein
MFQTALREFAGVGVQHGNLLVACMQITTYNHHRSAPFLRALVALSASKSTRSLGADTVISSNLPSIILFLFIASEGRRQFYDFSFSSGDEGHISKSSC